MMRDETDKSTAIDEIAPLAAATIAQVRQFTGRDWDEGACGNGVACGCQIKLEEQAMLESCDAPSSKLGEVRDVPRGTGG